VLVIIGYGPDKHYHPISEEIMRQRGEKSKRRISKVEVTRETLTSRGGMALFTRYIDKVGIIGLLASSFGHIRKSKKGAPVRDIFKQVLCFFYDGTSRHLAYFDELREDAGYAGVIESRAEEMVSSHQVKRFFMAFSWMCGRAYRGILKRMFLWRLRVEKPDLIELSIDTMVMDNDEAEKREGADSTGAGGAVRHP
jgi:hypothetical protein